MGKITLSNVFDNYYCVFNSNPEWAIPAALFVSEEEAVTRSGRFLIMTLLQWRQQCKLKLGDGPAEQGLTQ